MAADCVVIRHTASGAPHTLAKLTKASIINGGDGAHEHPTQALLDASTIRQRKGRLERSEGRDHRRHRAQPRRAIQYASVDKIRFTRLAMLRADTDACSDARKWSARTASYLHLTHSMDEAVEDADVIMMLRVQFERMSESFFPVCSRILPILRIDQRARRHGRSRTSSSCIPGR